MLQKREVRKSEKFIERLIQFFVSAKVVLLSVLGVIAFALIFYFVYTEVRKNQREKSSALVESAEDLYLQWSSESDEELKEQLETRVLGDLELVTQEYGRSYASQRALFIKGTLFVEKEDWQEAYTTFLDLARRFPRSYLAPEALFNAALSREEFGYLSEAIELLEELTDKYPVSPRAPHAFFSLGRLYEAIQQHSNALRVYNLIKLEYPSSNWTNFAVNRIIELKSRGQTE
jgi:tetratricopeptide (TPR) repeat protein